MENGAETGRTQNRVMSAVPGRQLKYMNSRDECKKLGESFVLQYRLGMDVDKGDGGCLC